MKLVKDVCEDEHANQMSLISDTAEVIKFLEFVGEKAIINSHTVHCRLSACNHLFSILNEEENNIDYMLENLDLLMNRFKNKITNVSAGTVKVYKSRVKSTLEDYKCWSRDPLAWEKSISTRAQELDSKAKKEKRKKNAPAVKKNVAKEKPAAPAGRTPNHGRRVIFPIRANFEIEMVIPADGLTLKELNRIGLFLYPYCRDIEVNENESLWPQLSH